MENPKRVALITGGTRGIGKGITQALVATGDYQGFLLTYNTNQQAAQEFANSLQAGFGTGTLKVVVVGGDLTEMSTRNAIFDTLDQEFAFDNDFQLACLVHNAGQLIGLTSDNTTGIKPSSKVFGDGSLLGEDGKLILEHLHYYQKLYSEAWIDMCERSIFRIKAARERLITVNSNAGASFRASIIGISSPGCSLAFKRVPGYDMPGSGKCVMEWSVRSYAANVGAFGINCNVVIPGYTRSDAWHKVAEQRGVPRDDMLQGAVQSLPIQQVIEPKDIGEVVAFLAGSGAGRFMTGLSLNVDGGLHLGVPSYSHNKK